MPGLDLWRLFDDYEDSVVADLTDSLQRRGEAAHRAGDHVLGNEYYALSLASEIALLTRQRFDYAEGSSNS